MIRQATKKPVTIEFVEWNGTNRVEVEAFVGKRLFNGLYLIIPTLEGEHNAMVGDMIIKGVKGEFYPCKPDIFAMTYDTEYTS